MFEKIVTAVEPFGLVMVIISGLVLTNRIQVSDHVIVGYVTVFIGVSLAIVHVIKQVQTKTTPNKRKD